MPRTSIGVIMPRTSIGVIMPRTSIGVIMPRTLCFFKLCTSFLATVCSAAVLSAVPVYASEKVVVYSYRQPFLVEHLFEKFTAQTGIAVEVLYAKKGLIERLKLEGQNSPADILLTSNSLRLVDAKEAGLTQKINRPEVTAAIPASLRDADGHWIGLTRRGRVLFANRNVVNMTEIQDYTDLARPENDYRICLRPWRHAYNISLVAYMLSSIGEAATQEWIEAVQSKLGRKPQGNDRAQIRAVNAGECDIAIANSYYFGVMQADPAQSGYTTHVDSVFPTLDGQYGTFGFVSGLALLNSADNTEAAGKLIDFMVSPSVQKAYAENNHEFSVYRLHSGQNPDEAKLDNRPLSDIFTNRAAALDLINRLIP